MPKRHIATTSDLTEADEALVGKLVRAAAAIAAEKGYADRGYRTVFNCNAEAGQTVFHIHLHLLAGQASGLAAGVGIRNCRLQIADCRFDGSGTIRGVWRRAFARGPAGRAGSRSAPGPAPGAPPHARPRPGEPELHQQHAVGCQPRRRLRQQRPRLVEAVVAVAVQAPAAGSWSRTSGLSVWLCDDGTYGGLATIRSNGPGASSSSDVSTNVTRSPTPRRSAFSRATASAAGEISVAVTRAPASSCASVMARQPLPVPTSAMAHARLRVAQPRQRRLDDELGLGPGNEHCRRDEELEVPELAAADDVGHRLAPFAGARPAPRRRPRRLAPAARHAASDRSRDPTPARAAPAPRRRLPPDRAGFPRE